MGDSVQNPGGASEQSLEEVFVQSLEEVFEF